MLLINSLFRKILKNNDLYLNTKQEYFWNTQQTKKIRFQITETSKTDIIKCHNHYNATYFLHNLVFKFLPSSLRYFLFQIHLSVTIKWSFSFE